MMDDRITNQSSLEENSLLKRFYEDLSSINISSLEEDEEDDLEINFYRERIAASSKVTSEPDRSTEKANEEIFENDPDWLLLQKGLEDVGTFADVLSSNREEKEITAPRDEEIRGIISDSFKNLSDAPEIALNICSNTDKPFEILELMDSLIESIEYLALFEQDLQISQLQSQTVNQEIPSLLTENNLVEENKIDLALLLESVNKIERNDEMIPSTSRSTLEDTVLESESRLLLEQQMQRNLFSKELEDQYIKKVEDERIKQDQEREREIKEQEDRKKKRLEIFLQVQREAKATTIQKNYRRFFQRKHYLYWKLQKTLEEAERLKQQQHEQQQRDLQLLAREEKYSRKFERDFKQYLEEQEQLLLKRQRSSKFIQSYYRGFITRKKIIPRFTEQRESLLMQLEEELSLRSIARLPVEKRQNAREEMERDQKLREEEAELIFLDSNDPRKRSTQEQWFSSFPYHRLKTSDSEKMELIERCTLSKRLSFTYASSQKPMMPKLKAEIRRKREISKTELILTSLAKWIESSEALSRTKLQSNYPENLSNDSQPITTFQRFYHQQQQLFLLLKKEKEKELSTSSITSSGELVMPNVDNLDLAVEGVSSLNFLSQYPMLRRLILNVNQITSLDALSTSSPLLPFLQVLSISDNKLTDISPLNSTVISAISPLPTPSFQSMLSLTVDSNRLQYVDLRHLTSLHYFSANCNQLKSFPLLSSSYLTKIELYNNNITKITVDDVKHLPALLYLNLGKNQIDTIEETWYFYTPLLQTLILSQNQLSNFIYPLHLPCLLALWLNGNRITQLIPSSVSVHSSFSCDIFAPQLKKLYLQDNQLSSLRCGNSNNNNNSNLESLFSQFPLLQEIDLSFNRIERLEDLTPLSSCQYINSLKCNDNPLYQRVNPNTVVITDTVVTKEQVKKWCKDTFRFLNSLDGEIVPKSTIPMDNLSRSFSGHEKDNAKRLQGERLLHLLHQMKMEYDEMIFRMRKKKKLSPLEESLQQLQNDVSMVYLAHCQKEKLFSFFSIATDAEVVKLSDNLLVYSLTSAPILEAAHNSVLLANSQVTTQNSSATNDLSSNFMPTIPKFASKTLNRLLQQSIEEVKEQDEKKRTEHEQKQLLEQFQASEKSEMPNAVSPKVISSLIKLQACYRGYRMRDKVRKYLSSINYEDDDLESILKTGLEGDDETGIFDMNELLQLEQELEFNPFSSQQAKGLSKKPPSRSNSTVRTSSNDNMSIPSMAYGDHIRKRNNLFVGDVTTQNDQIVPTLAMHNVSSNVGAPLTTPRSVHSTASSAKTISDAASLPSSASALAAAELGKYLFKSPREMKEAAAVAEDWGIVDQKLLSTLTKRNHRIKNFLHAKENREKEKDSTVRYQKFLKQQAKVGATSTSTTHRSGGGGRGIRRTGRNGNGKGVRDHLLIPAWMKKEGDDEQDYDGGENDDEYEG